MLLGTVCKRRPASHCLAASYSSSLGPEACPSSSHRFDEKRARGAILGA